MKNLILSKNIIGIGVFSAFLLFIFFFSEDFVCEHTETLYRQFCPIQVDSFPEIRFYTGIILIHLFIIFTRLSPFYQRIYTDKSSSIVLMVLSIVSVIFLNILLKSQISDHDGGGPLGSMTLFHVIIIPLSFVLFILFTIVYSIMKKNVYSILFYFVLGGLYYLTESTHNESIGIIWFGIILIGLYFLIFHLLWYLFDKRDFIDK